MSAQAAERVSPRGPWFYGYTVAAAASFSMVLVFAVHYSFGIFFLPVLTELGWTRATTAGAFSLVWVVQGLLAIVMGGLNDKFGSRLVLTVCGMLVGAGYLLMSQVSQIWHIYLFYGVIVGAGLSGTFVPLTSTTARWFVARRGLMTGIVTAGVGIGALIGPPTVSWLIGGYSWRTAYLVLGSVVMVGVTTAAQFLRRDPAQMGLRPYGDPSVTGGPSIAVVGLSLREALRTWQFWVLCAAFHCYGFSLSAVLLHLAPHAADLGMSATTGATLVSLIGGASIVGKVLLGNAVDSIGNQRVFLICFALMALSLFCLTVMTELLMLYAFAAVFGFAYGGLAAAHSPIVAWLFGLRQHGLIFGVSFNGWTLGCALGPIVAGYVFDGVGSYQAAFLGCALLSLVGGALTYILKPVAVGSRRMVSTTLTSATT